MLQVQSGFKIGQDAYLARLERRRRYVEEVPSITQDIGDSRFILERAISLGLVVQSDVIELKTKTYQFCEKPVLYKGLLEDVAAEIRKRFDQLSPHPTTDQSKTFSYYAEDIAAVVMDISCLSLTLEVMRDIALLRVSQKSKRYDYDDLRRERHKREKRAMTMQASSLSKVEAADEVLRLRKKLKILNKRIRSEGDSGSGRNGADEDVGVPVVSGGDASATP